MQKVHFEDGKADGQGRRGYGFINLRRRTDGERADYYAIKLNNAMVEIGEIKERIRELEDELARPKPIEGPLVMAPVGIYPESAFKSE